MWATPKDNAHALGPPRGKYTVELLLELTMIFRIIYLKGRK